MKYAMGAGLVLFAILATAFVALSLMPVDVVTSTYPSLEAARKDGLFDRGWLPNILPLSAHTIRTSNNLDLNTSEGEFSIKPSEYPLLAAHVSPYQTASTPFVSFEESVASMKAKGFEVSMFSDEGSTWVFFCKLATGYCEYTMWLRRDAS